MIAIPRVSAFQEALLQKGEKNVMHIIRKKINKNKNAVKYSRTSMAPTPMLVDHGYFELVNESLWGGGAMVLGKLPVPRRPTIWMVVGQGPIALAVGAGGGCLAIFTLLYLFSPLSPSLWQTARYRLNTVSKDR